MIALKSAKVIPERKRNEFENQIGKLSLSKLFRKKLYKHIYLVLYKEMSCFRFWGRHLS